MSGIEVAAAIFGIIGGVASAYKMVVQLRKRYQKFKKSNTAKSNRFDNIEQRLKRIEKQLKLSETRLASLNHVGSASGNQVALYSDMAIQNVLTVLQQISNVQIQDPNHLPERFDLSELERYTDRWDREASLISRTICPNAVRYRRNLCRFVDVAVQRVPGSQWACRLCGICVSPASLPFSISFPYEGQLHITPNGSFKAHTIEDSSWSCIWKGRSEKCLGLFRGRRALLGHMQSEHIRYDVSARKLLIDGPGDTREHSVARCGYGILHPSKKMEIAEDGFVIKYGES